MPCAHTDQEFGHCGIAGDFAADADGLFSLYRHPDHLVQQRQYRRMQGIVEFTHTGIVTVYGESVLNEVVRSETDEVEGA